MKYFLAILLIIFLSCEEIMTTQNTKPTVAEFNPPAGTNVELPPSIVLENGFFDGDPDNPLYAKYFNALRKESFRVADYLLQDVRQIYVKCSAGNDTTGDGSQASPYRTIPKAHSMIAPNAYTVIWLDESGTYTVNANSDHIAKRVKILESSGVTAVVAFGSHVNDSDNNDLHGFDVRGGSLAISASQILTTSPFATGKDWDVNASAIRVYDSVASITLSGSVKIEFSAVTASSGVPKLVKTMVGDGLTIGFPVLNIIGTITTNDNGYVLDASNNLAIVSKNGTIDNPAYQATGLLSQNQILSTGDLGGSPASFKIKVSAGDLLSVYETSALPNTTTDADIKTAIETLLNANSNTGSIEVTVTTTRNVGSGVTNLTIEIGGTYSGKKIYTELLYIGVGEECYFEEIQAPKPLSYNVITN